VTFLNDFAEKLFGFSQSEMLGHSIVGTIVPASPEAEKNLQGLIEDIVQQPDRFTQNEYQFVKKNGEPVWVMWTNRPLFDDQGNLQSILRVGIDRTAHRRDQQALEQQMREQAAAAERNRLARDLHDAVSQTLFSASLIAEVLPNLWERDEAQGQKRLEEVRQLTRGALAEMRTLLLELRPSSLIEADLGYLLKQLGESITGRSRVPVEVSVSGHCSPRPDVKVAIYRIAQESLNNIAKHSEANRAVVTLLCESDKVALRVTDNGRGFDSGAVRQDSLGLGIMRERARQIGASLSIRSKPGKGTRIMLTWKGSPEAER
jgi:PAS domain S-box-containing protein